jgi:hypothetical protein
MAEEGPGIGERELAATAHRHLFRRIEAPELTPLLQERTEYQPAALQHVEGGYLCEGCDTLGSVVYSGAQHPVHYLSNAGAL